MNPRQPPATSAPGEAERADAASAPVERVRPGAWSAPLRGAPLVASSPSLPADGPADAAASRAAALQALFDAVRARPWAHDFFALLRRVECLHPEAPRLGRALRPSQEAMRLGQDAELDFAPAALSSFGAGGRAAAPRLGVRFFGLLGSQGPMPLHLTEHVRERQRFRNDPTTARFLDIFHHRLLTLFYRAWAQAQPTAQHDRPDDDRYAAWLGATFGLVPASRDHGAPPERARLFQAGLLGGRSRHAEGLTKLLSQHFGVPVAIDSHVAHWMAIDPDDRSRLGHARNRAEGRAARGAVLGMSANAGSRVHDRQSRFRVVLGPLTLAQYRGFLPRGAAWPQLAGWVHQYVGLGLRWDVELRLADAEVPEPRLGRGVALGVSSWLIGRSHPARQALRLRPERSFLFRSGAAHA